MPEDLLKFGLIPEFIGRLPVIVTLSPLTVDDLMRVLVEPKNAVTRQFQKFLQLDKVELVFTHGALRAAAEVAIDRKTGARALRSIVEEALLEVMYDIPERTDVRKCIITEETIRDGRAPLLLTKSGRRQGRRRDELRGVARGPGRERLTTRSSASSALAGDPDARTRRDHGEEAPAQRERPAPERAARARPAGARRRKPTSRPVARRTRRSATGSSCSPPW